MPSAREREKALVASLPAFNVPVYFYWSKNAADWIARLGKLPIEALRVASTTIANEARMTRNAMRTDVPAFEGTLRRSITTKTGWTVGKGRHLSLVGAGRSTQYTIAFEAGYAVPQSEDGNTRYNPFILGWGIDQGIRGHPVGVFHGTGILGRGILGTQPLDPRPKLLRWIRQRGPVRLRQRIANILARGSGAIPKIVVWRRSTYGRHRRGRHFFTQHTNRFARRVPRYLVRAFQAQWRR